jgi:hypothetical protein
MYAPHLAGQAEVTCCGCDHAGVFQLKLLHEAGLPMGQFSNGSPRRESSDSSADDMTGSYRRPPIARSSS